MRSNFLQRWLTALSLWMVAVVIALTGHQTATAQQSASEVELSPAEFPVVRVGDKKVWRLKNGKESTSEVTGVDDESISGRRGDGCTWKAVSAFGPSLEWSGCGGSAGKQTIKEREGNLFPLQVGNTARWKFRGKNNKGYSWSGTRKCNVNGTANVTVPAGTFDTYHIVCTEQWSRREWHYSPELGTTVTFRTKPKGTSRRKPSYGELVSFTPGT